MIVLTLCLSAALAGCTSGDRLSAVPRDRSTDALVLGRSDLRYWPGSPASDELLIRDGGDAFRRELAEYPPGQNPAMMPPAHYLAVSGGAEDGAFGAGVLVGWTRSGTRPSFKLVTGISTGALTAPFAFLGPTWDEALTAVYTEIEAAQIYEERNVLMGIFGDGLYDTTPLRRLIAKHLDADMLAAIAREHERGRMLLIGTTDLDARRAVIWNIGKIAASGHPGALDLVHDILVASAAVPGAFPPVMVDVTLDGQPRHEMHVDGGASAQVFLIPPSINLSSLHKKAGFERQRRAWIIRNARLDPDWAETKRQTLDIAARAISSLIQSQGVGDLYRMYSTAQRDGIAFNLAYIPYDFTMQSKTFFDQQYMKAAFDRGVAFALSNDWRNNPPGWSGAP